MTAAATRPPSAVVEQDRRRRLGRSALPWLAGLALGVVMLGPLLGPGSLLNLDLVLTPQLPVPRGAWGLGPELPRRVPIWIVAGWLSPLLGGATTGKLLLLGSIVVAFVGMHRLVRHAGPLAAYSAALLYAVSPFLLTRLVVGHFMIIVPMALLPWVVRRLLDPGDDVWRTFLAVAVLAFAGHYGGTVATIIVLVGLATTRGRNGGKVLGLTLLAQLPWIVPGIVVYAQGASIVDAAPFSTYVGTIDDAARVLAGHGFWQPGYQVGYPGGWSVALAGVVLAALAVYGSRDLDGPLRRLPILAAIGLTLTFASVVPLVSDVFVWASRTALGSVLREGHRVLPLYLVWMAPAAALGARRLGQRVLRPAAAGDGSGVDEASTVGAARGALAAVVQAVPLALALVLALPAAWGIDPRVRPVELPAEWTEARDVVSANPGPVLALPWHQYFNMNIIGNRRVLDPAPLFLGGDVITSSDPELDQADRKEHVDAREARLDAVLAEARQGRPISADLARTGIRWIFLQHEVDWLRYGTLGADPGLRRVVHGQTLDLYEVAAYRGPMVDEAGVPVPADPVVEPYLSADASGAATYQRPAARGWLRGTASAGATGDGTVALPGGSGPVWYWPAVLVLAADAATLVLVAVALRHVRRTPRRPVTTGPDVPADAP